MPPMALAAFTYSRFFCLRNSARVSLAMAGQDTIPIARTIVIVLAVNSATTTIANSKPGSTWKNSVIRIRMLSTQPP